MMQNLELLADNELALKICDYAQSVELYTVYC